MDSNETNRPLTEVPMDKTPETLVSSPAQAEENNTMYVPKQTKEEVIKRLKELNEDACNADKQELDLLKQTFYKLHKAEQETARKTFIEAGGAPEAFVMPSDDSESRFKEAMSSIKEKRSAMLAEQEKEKEENLQKKLAIIEKLKELSESHDDANKAYNEFKKLQQEWNEIKQVPAAKINELWKNYQLYAEKFYDLIKLNNEFREYDFKKNLEIKLHLCEAAEKLANEEDIISAFHQLQKLHQEFRDTGPVAKELREEIWTRFKTASTTVNRRHQQHFEALKEKEQRNLDEKTVICEIVETMEYDTFTTFQDWENKTQEVIALQAKWKTIGYAPQKMNVKIFERFRSACDEFFKRKAEFFKSVKENMSGNLEKKKELCEKAEALKDSTDWKTTADALIELQKEWKKIGPVPKKSGDAVWKKFIEACDYFFENKNKNVRNVHQEERANLEKKRVLVEKLKNIDEAMPKADIRNLLKDMSAEFKGIGHVPFKERDKIYNEYKTALNAAYDKFDLDGKKMRMNNFVSNVSEISNDKNKLFKERERLVRLYEQKKNEVKTFENNLGFFNVTSKTGGAVLKEMENRIARAKKDLETLEEQIGLIDEKL